MCPFIPQVNTLVSVHIGSFSAPTHTCLDVLTERLPYITMVLLFKSVEQSKKGGEALQNLASETLFTWAYAITLFSVKPINASRPALRSRSEEGSGTVSPERENAALNGP